MEGPQQTPSPVHSEQQPNNDTSAPTDPDRRTFGTRVVSVVITILPHLTLNIFLAALRGMELAFTRPIEALGALGERIDPNHRIARALACGAGYCFGFIIGITAAIPGLLIGVLCGIGRAIYKLPSALIKSWFQGASYAMNQTFDDYNINKRHVVAIGAIISLLLASAFISMGGVIGGPPLAGLITILETPAFLASFTTLAYLYADRPSSIERSSPENNSEERSPPPSPALSTTTGANFLSSIARDARFCT